MDIKKIVILGAGNMGGWLVESLCLDYEVAVYDTDKHKLKYFFNSYRFTSLEEIRDFKPDMLINAVSLQNTTKAFDDVMPYLSEDCILCDITSVKNGLHNYYKESKHRFVSTHPMFGPTFANIKELKGQNAIIIKESDEEGKKFFRRFYHSLEIEIYEYSFQVHDQTIAYSLSIPFSSTLIFAACIKKQEAPGTTFKKHMAIAEGLLSENDFLLTEVLFNPYTMEHLGNIKEKLEYLTKLVEERNVQELRKFFAALRKNIE
jgi:prephenate dehydrogenase